MFGNYIMSNITFLLFILAHIFFDDAFQYHDEYSGNEFEVNDYVKGLVSVVDISAR